MAKSEDTNDKRQRTSAALRVVLLSALGAGLIWIILTRSFAASLAWSSPETALWLQPREPRALLNRAKSEFSALPEASEVKVDMPDQALALFPGGGADSLSTLSRLAEDAFLSEPDWISPSSKSMRADVPALDRGADRIRAIRRLAEAAIAAEPFNADALDLLGQLAERTGEPARTAPLMEAAAHLSIRESYAVYWLMRRSQRARDYANVLRYADILLRTRGRSLPLVVPVLAQMAEAKDADADVSQLLKNNPPWRPAFFANLSRSISDARTPLYLLLGLQSTAHPPTALEISGYINFLISKNFHELAYYTWLQFLPADELARISPLYNRSFESVPSGLPFDWSLTQGSGVTTEIRPRSDTFDEHALFLQFGQGRSEFAGVTQLTLLGPGTYELKGKHKGTLAGPRGLVWRVTCAGAQSIAQSELIRGDIPQWRDFTLGFTVPQTGCRAQQVRLDLDARSASEKIITGSMWFDELSLNRSPGAPTGPVGVPTLP